MMAPISSNAVSQTGSTANLFSFLKSKLNGDQASASRSTDIPAKPWLGVIPLKYEDKNTKIYECDIKSVNIFLP